MEDLFILPTRAGQPPPPYQRIQPSPPLRSQAANTLHVLSAITRDYTNYVNSTFQAVEAEQTHRILFQHQKQVLEARLEQVSLVPCLLWPCVLSLPPCLQRALSPHHFLLSLPLEQAETYEEWAAAASQLDRLEGRDHWKETNDSDEYYNPELIASVIAQLDSARENGDARRMLGIIRCSLLRNLGGSGRACMYNHSHVGTKKLIEEYVTASVDTIQALITETSRALPKGLSQKELMGDLLLARQVHGRTALVLSGGSVFGMVHIGVLKALFENHSLPRVISGTSAGSIVASVVCMKKDDEIPDVLKQFAHGDLAVFTDKDRPDSWFGHLRRVWDNGAWHDNRHLRRVMRSLLGDITFQEAFNRTGRILNISVSSKEGLSLPSLLNYMTAPNVIIWSAVVASCSVPGVFGATTLLMRDEIDGSLTPWDPAGQLWVDGSLDNDIPAQRLRELFGVNHFIVSQANPHVAAFLPTDHGISESNPFSVPTLEHIRNWCSFAGSCAKSELAPWMHHLTSLTEVSQLGWANRQVRMLNRLLSQWYTADINIIPRMGLAWAPYLIRNPTPEFMDEACRIGERATWPLLCRIRNSCAIELALDRAVTIMRERITFSDSQINLRRLYTGSSELGIKQGDVKIHRRHCRRGSGGSIQLKARRQGTRDSLDDVFSESAHDSDPESQATSLAKRRGLEGMKLDFLVHMREQAGRGGSLARQNSLQNLPVAKTPTGSPVATRVSSPAAYKFVGGLQPLTTIHRRDAQEPAGDDDTDSDTSESPVLQLRVRRSGSGSPPRGPGPEISAGRIEEETTTDYTDQTADEADIDDNVSDAEPYDIASP